MAVGHSERVVGSKSRDVNVVLCVLQMREKMEQLSSLVRSDLKEARSQQKTRYDQIAREEASRRRIWYWSFYQPVQPNQKHSGKGHTKY